MQNETKHLLDSDEIGVMEASATKRPQINKVLTRALSDLHGLGIALFIKDVQGLYQEVLMQHASNPEHDPIEPGYHSDMICRMFQAFDALYAIDTEVRKGGLVYG